MNDIPLLDGHVVRKPLGNALMPYGTPQHVSELIMLILKLTFGDLPDTHPYRFRQDINETGLLFDVVYNKEADIWGKKPLIVVSRGPQSAGIIMTGDLATENLRLHQGSRSNLVESSVIINVVSKLRGECANIGQLVFSTLLTSRTLLPGLCGIHSVQNISMSQESKLELDDTCFMLQLVLQYSMQYIWEITSPQHMLQSVLLHLQDTENTDDNRTFTLGDKKEEPSEAIFNQNITS